VGLVDLEEPTDGGSLMPATSFKIRGIEPPDLKDYPPSVRKLFWGWVVEYGLKRKDLELSKGLDKDGKPLRPIRPKTRRYRRSAMTPTGKGDPSAPPLTPGHQLSRPRSLLAGRALTTHAEFYWRFDAFTGDSFGVVLAYQKEKGRDVFGLSPKGTAWVQRMALKRWERYKAGQAGQAGPVRPARVSPGLPTVGSYDMTHATMGIGSADTSKGRWTGGMTWPEWQRYFTAQAKAIPGRPAGPSNRLLEHVWGVGGQSGAAKAAKPGAKPPGPSKTKVAMAPKPKPSKPIAVPPEAVPVPPRPFAELVHLAVQAVPSDLLYGDNKAWIHHVWAAYRLLPGVEPLSLEAFKALLAETLETRMLLMAGDLAVVRYPAEAARAETSYLSTMFHFMKKIFRR
jgi:hypothetical protein